jgi:hypothetical protein
MTKVVMTMLAVGALAALFAVGGCDDKKPEAKPAPTATAVAAAPTHAAPAKSAAPGGGW